MTIELIFTPLQETPIRIKFMDLSSCPGGINRRDTCLVLALTDASGTCLGRKMLPVRVCSQPKRDRANEEESFKMKEQIYQYNIYINFLNDYYSDSNPKPILFNESLSKRLFG